MALSFQRELNQVLFEENAGARKVILNRPKKLNILNYEMVCQMLKKLEAYENDPTVKLVILKGNGKAFCAGGDVIAVVTFITSGHWSFGASFYRKQLTLDYLLGTYKKPLVSLINGIVMGGGAGISMHATFRIVTEKTVFAMPETSIGLFPDVGASHFLSRLPGFFGEYLGLTGARLDGIEMLTCGLATHFVNSKFPWFLRTNSLGCGGTFSSSGTTMPLSLTFLYKAAKSRWVMDIEPDFGMIGGVEPLVSRMSFPPSLTFLLTRKALFTNILQGKPATLIGISTSEEPCMLGNCRMNLDCLVCWPLLLHQALDVWIVWSGPLLLRVPSLQLPFIPIAPLSWGLIFPLPNSFGATYYPLKSISLVGLPGEIELKPQLSFTIGASLVPTYQPPALFVILLLNLPAMFCYIVLSLGPFGLLCYLIGESFGASHTL